MFAVHGARVMVTNREVVVSPTLLAASLRGDSADRVIPLAEITGMTEFAGDSWSPSSLELKLADGALTLHFYPTDPEGPKALVALIEAARRGEAPEAAAVDGAAGIPGLSFVALDVETANQQWGSICQIGMVKVIDGEEVERVSWKCRPPTGLDSFDPFNVSIHGITAEDVADCPAVGDLMEDVAAFIGELPMVAHNAQFDASALRYACLASHTPVPRVMFACTLALSRATKLDVQNHRLPTLAEHFNVALDNHHDAAADAAACAGILTGLARGAGYEGSLMGFVHGAGFALGSIDHDRVTPVLRDRSGATRALQAKAAKQGSMTAVVDAVVEPEGNNQNVANAPKRTRRPAPWDAVATPDMIPEPDATADPNSPLYGENVTLTGDFEPFDKGELWAGIAAHGGQVGKNVTKKTTILVAGEWATMTSKEKRARELQEKGQEIQIWTAAELLEALGYDE